MAKKKKILLVTDRSAGHAFPACSLIEYLKKDRQVYFFTTSDYIRSKLFGEGLYFVGREFPRRNLVLEACFRFIEAFFILLIREKKERLGI